jgi:F-type H+-transporting ATPase subunit gamma
MPELEAIKRTMRSIEALQSIVKTLKSLAAVNIRQHQQAVAALTAYEQTIALGLQAVLREEPVLPAAPAAAGILGLIVFGSDQGLCGRFSEQSVEAALALLDTLGAQRQHSLVLAVGRRTANRLAEAAQPVALTCQVPSSLAGALPLVQDLLVSIDTWRTEYPLSRLVLVYNHWLSGASYQPVVVSLLPIDLAQFRPPHRPRWPGRSLPLYPTTRQELLAALLRQHFFVALHRAVTESLASENASRLVAMQAAESSIATRLEELRTLFRSQRQHAITAELLDLVAGCEALTFQAQPLLLAKR